MCVQVLNQRFEPMKHVVEDVPILVEEEMTASPSVQENCHFTRSMARPSGSGTAVSEPSTSLLNWPLMTLLQKLELRPHSKA